MEKIPAVTKEPTFEELSYPDQAKSLATQIKGLEKSITIHLRRSNTEGKDMYEAREKLIVQLERIIKGIG